MLINLRILDSSNLPKSQPNLWQISVLALVQMKCTFITSVETQKIVSIMKWKIVFEQNWILFHCAVCSSHSSELLFKRMEWFKWLRKYPTLIVWPLYLSKSRIWIAIFSFWVEKFVQTEKSKIIWRIYVIWIRYLHHGKRKHDD